MLKKIAGRLICISLQMEVSDDGTLWHSVPTPRWAQVFAQQAQSATAEPSCAVSVASAQLRWDIQPGCEWVVEWLVCRGKLWLLVLFACVLGVAGRVRLGVLALAFNFALTAGILAGILAFRATDVGRASVPLGDASPSEQLVQRVGINLIVATALLWEGPLLIDIVLISCTLLTIMNTAHRFRVRSAFVGAAGSCSGWACWPEALTLGVLLTTGVCIQVALVFSFAMVHVSSRRRGSEFL